MRFHSNCKLKNVFAIKTPKPNMSKSFRKVTIYLLTSCNTEERRAQNIFIHNSNRNYKKLTTTTLLIKFRFLINIVVVVDFFIISI